MWHAIAERGQAKALETLSTFAISSVPPDIAAAAAPKRPTDGDFDRYAADDDRYTAASDCQASTSGRLHDAAPWHEPDRDTCALGHMYHPLLVLALNSRDSSSLTPLHLACREGHASVVRALLDAGADPWAVEYRNHTSALHFAALGGHAACVEAIMTSPRVRSMRLVEADGSRRKSARKGGKSSSAGPFVIK